MARAGRERAGAATADDVGAVGVIGVVQIRDALLVDLVFDAGLAAEATAAGRQLAEQLGPFIEALGAAEADPIGGIAIAGPLDRHLSEDVARPVLL